MGSGKPEGIFMTNKPTSAAQVAAKEIADRWIRHDLPPEAAVQSLSQLQLEALACHVIAKGEPEIICPICFIELAEAAGIHAWDCRCGGCPVGCPSSASPDSDLEYWRNLTAEADAKNKSKASTPAHPDLTIQIAFESGYEEGLKAAKTPHSHDEAVATFVEDVGKRIDHALVSEREACAVIAETYDIDTDSTGVGVAIGTQGGIAFAIRNRKVDTK